MSKRVRRVEAPACGHPGLTTSEDRELRQLTWFCRVGDLSEKAKARVFELLGRDRRAWVRDPRPNPSSPAADELTTLPPLQMDEIVSITCPSCGAILPDNGRAD
jgi:hypothetical protein